MRTPLRTFVVRLPEEMHEALRDRALAEFSPAAVIVRRALDDYLRAVDGRGVPGGVS